MRLNLPSATALMPLALLGACASHHSGPEPVEGLVYECRTPGSTDVSEALIVFNGQGYQPGNVVLTADGEAPRSTARLTFAGREHDLRAGWTYLGMRYRSVEPIESGRVLVWAADGENAHILSAPEQADGEETELASCTRQRHVAGAPVPDEHHGAEDTHHR